MALLQLQHAVHWNAAEPLHQTLPQLHRWLASMTAGGKQITPGQQGQTSGMACAVHAEKAIVTKLLQYGSADLARGLSLRACPVRQFASPTVRDLCWCWNGCCYAALSSPEEDGHQTCRRLPNIRCWRPCQVNLCAPLI